MNEQTLSFIRTLVQTAAASLGTYGVLDAQGQVVVVSFVMWLIPTVWGLYVRRKAGLVASAAALPEVAKIVATPDIVAKVTDPTVVSRG
ncbi:holin [Pseudanabaena phage Pam3]|nr:holin [Pseudanabaena phage Pam3]